MKKALSLLAIVALSLGTVNAYAQEDMAATEEVAETAATETMDSADAAVDSAAATTDSAATQEEAPAEEAAVEEAPAEKGFTQILKEKFIEGGAFFMSFVLLALVLGLALVIERIIYLTFAQTNTEKLLEEVEGALNNGGVEAAKEVCRNTRGPVATIFFEGLDHYDEGLDMVDKSIMSVGSVENGKLEKGVSWISLFIALAPMLGFMGTVIGMIGAFDAIEAAGDINPSLVAGGIKVALLTTVFGLITAIILQIFYNLIVAMIDGIVIKMEDASISFMDMLVDYNKKKRVIQMLSKLPLIGRVLGIGLGLVGVVLFIMVAVNENNAPGFVSFGMISTILGIIIAVLSFVLALVVNPQGIKGVGIGLAAILVIGLISWFTADGSDFNEYKDVTEATSKASSAMLTSFYILFSGAILAVVYSLVSRVTK
jgi:biopolymer transport protein ExbB